MEAAMENKKENKSRKRDVGNAHSGSDLSPQLTSGVPEAQDNQDHFLFNAATTDQNDEVKIENNLSINIAAQEASSSSNFNIKTSSLSSPKIHRESLETFHTPEESNSSSEFSTPNPKISDNQDSFTIYLTPQGSTPVAKLNNHSYKFQNDWLKLVPAESYLTREESSETSTDLAIGPNKIEIQNQCNKIQMENKEISMLEIRRWENLQAFNLQNTSMDFGSSQEQLDVSHSHEKSILQSREQFQISNKLTSDRNQIDQNTNDNQRENNRQNENTILYHTSTGEDITADALNKNQKTESMEILHPHEQYVATVDIGNGEEMEISTIDGKETEEWKLSQHITKSTDAMHITRHERKCSFDSMNRTVSENSSSPKQPKARNNPAIHKLQSLVFPVFHYPLHSAQTPNQSMQSRFPSGNALQSTVVQSPSSQYYHELLIQQPQPNAPSLQSSQSSVIPRTSAPPSSSRLQTEIPLCNNQTSSDGRATVNTSGVQNPSSLSADNDRLKRSTGTELRNAQINVETAQFTGYVRRSGISVHIARILDTCNAMSGIVKKLLHSAMKVLCQMQWIAKVLPSVINELSKDLEVKIINIKYVTDNLYDEIRNLSASVQNSRPKDARYFIKDIYEHMNSLYNEIHELIHDCKYVLNKYDSRLKHFDVRDNVIRIRIKIDFKEVAENLKKCVQDYILAEENS